MPARSTPVCRSGTEAIKSDPPRERERAREAVDDGRDLARHPERLQRVVDLAARGAAPRDVHVPPGRVARRGDRSLG
jgi:hypothetical protein